MRVVGLVLLMVMVLPASAGSFADVSMARTVSEQMMQKFLKEEFEEGISMAKKYWPLDPGEMDNLLEQIESSWKIVRNRYGAATGTEFIREERIGNSFVKLYYLHKFENHAIYWMFVYYKPTDSWVLNRLTFKDELDPLFEIAK